MAERGFSERTRHAETFAEQVYADIRAMGFDTSVNGVETKHPDFKAVSHNSTDKTSLSIRFAPDAIAWCGNTPRAFYLDAKAGLTVERFAWEQYGMLSEAGCVVVLAFKVLNAWAWNIQPCIRLLPPEYTMRNIPPKLRFVVHEGWLTPRLTAHWIKTKQRATHASGTPYREVDPASLLPGTMFYDTMIDILKNQVVFNPF